MVEINTWRPLFALVFYLVVDFSSAVSARDVSWAQPVLVHGVPNLHHVAPNLYRSAQPTAEGFKAAKDQLHLQTVVNLRESSSDAGLLAGTQIKNLSVPMNALHITDVEIIAALKIIATEKAKGPILVHCLQGSDRTGVVIAMYRILYEGWSKQQTIDEMRQGGFNFHSIFFNIPIFIQNANIPAFKRALAITP